MTAIRVLVADDQQLMREGLATLLSIAADLEVVGLAGDGAEALRLAQERRPDVVLMDIQMPTMDGLAATQAVRAALPGTQVIILTTFADDDYLVGALRAGACGYLLKDMPPSQLAEAIRAAHRGESPIGPAVARRLVSMLVQQPAPPAPQPAGLLSAREIEVLRLVARGLSNRAIAEALVIAEGTAKNHISNILGKLEARDRAEAVARGIALGLITA